MAQGHLKYRIALPITVVVSLLLAVSIVADIRLQKSQNEESLHEQAYILSEQIQAVWDFVTVNQNRINTDADGSYNFKGLHCSIAGTSVGALFTSRTDYIIRYASDNPRNEKNAADWLESEAIEAFRADENLDEYCAFDTEEDGIDYYRYLIPLRMDSDCASCHGKPAGEIDVSGFAKEGLSDGEVVGVANISIPTDTYQANFNEQIILRGLLSVAILAACLATVYCVTMRYVIRPIGKVASAVRDIGAGILKTRIDPEKINARGEMRTLSVHFNAMAEELDSFRRDLEEKVSERTEQLAEANAMLGERTRELEVANEQLKADNRYKSHYFTMMSHELRTPLTAIRAHIDMLKDAETLDEDEKKKVIRALRTNTLSLSRLVDNILDSARLEAGAVRLEKHVTDAADIINELMKTLEPLASAEEMRLLCRVDESTPLFLADGEKLLHILQNLGANAIKYSDRGGAIRIEAYAHPEDKTIRFSVSDDGIGIAEEDQRLIFQKFMQAESAVDRPVSGSGLGLSLAREYAHLHGGTIRLKSAPNEGSTFTVCIPYEKPDFDFD